MLYKGCYPFKPCFSHEVRKDVIKWEKGGVNDYHEVAKGVKIPDTATGDRLYF
jgi:hypothetical protein